jgi:hypothetical protein
MKRQPSILTNYYNSRLPKAQDGKQTSSSLLESVYSPVLETMYDDITTVGKTAGKIAAGTALGLTGLAGATGLAIKAAPMFNRFTDVNRKLAEIETDGRLKGLSDWEIGKMQMEQVGITSAQRTAYNPITSNFGEKYVYPFGYGGHDKYGSKLSQVWDAVKAGGLKNLDWFKEKHIPSRMDSWRMYLGKPQKHGTFEVASTSPFNHPAYRADQLSKLETFSITPNANGGKTYESIKPEGILKFGRNGIRNELMPKITIDRNITAATKPISFDIGHDVMGGYNKRLSSLGGLEYNDVWDLEPTIVPSTFAPEWLKESKLGTKLLYNINEKGVAVPKKFNIDMGRFLGKPFLVHGNIDFPSQQVYGEGLKSRLEQYRQSLLDNGYLPDMPNVQNVNKYINKLNEGLAKQTATDFGISDLESQIKNLKQQEALAEQSRKTLWADYKAGKITADEYTTEAKKLNLDPQPRFDLEGKLRQAKVKQDIGNFSQENILQSESQLGKDISTGGSNTKGVFELGNNRVARLSTHGYDDASRLVLYRDKIKSPRIAKTLQVKELNGKVYQVQEQVTGTPITKISEQEFKNIPKEHINNFWKDKAELDKLGLSIDISGGKANIFYDPKKGFQFIDLGIGQSPTNETVSKVYKGLEQSTPTTTSVTTPKRLSAAQTLRQSVQNRTSVARPSGSTEVAAPKVEMEGKVPEISPKYNWLPKTGKFLKGLIKEVGKKEIGGPIVSTQGYKQGPPPEGYYYRIPSNTLYNPTPYRIKATANTGQTRILNPFDESNVKFPGASYVDEYPMMQQGGWLEQYQTKGQVTQEPNKGDSIEVLNSTLANRKYYDALMKKGVYNSNVKYETYDPSNVSRKPDPDFVKDLKRKKLTSLMEDVKDAGLKSQRDILQHRGTVTEITAEANWLHNHPDKSHADYEKVVGKTLGGIKASGVANPYKYYYKDLAPSVIDPDAPFVTIDTRINPQYNVRYNVPDPNTSKASSGVWVDTVQYDPLAVTPWDMLNPQQQKQRLDQFGTSGTPYANPNYKPQTPQKPKTGGWKPLTPEVAKGRYSGDVSNMVYRETGDPDNPYNITAIPPKPEPTLNRKPVAVQPITANTQNFTPQLRTIEQPNIELPTVQRGKYRTSYYDPQMKDWNERAFMSQQESDQFADEMSNRGYPGSYGNVTQRVQYQLGGTAAYGGPLVKYMAGKMTGPNIFAKGGRLDQYQVAGETTYTHERGTGGLNYNPVRTVSPYLSNRDIRRYTQAPTSGKDVNFIANYGDFKRSFGKAGADYNPTSVPYEGSNHWNINRFIVDPHLNDSFRDLNVNASTPEERRASILADMYKYNMLQDPKHKGRAFRQAKRFVRREIDPMMNGAFLNDFLLNQKGTPNFNLMDPMNTFDEQNPLISLNTWNRGVSEDENMKKQNSNYNPSEWTADRVKNISMDYLRNYKKMSRRDARKQWNQWEQDAAAYEGTRKYQMANPGVQRTKTIPKEWANLSDEELFYKMQDAPVDGEVGWNVEYFDPATKKTQTKHFNTNREAEKFYNDSTNRASRKYSDTSSLGRMEKGGTNNSGLCIDKNGYSVPCEKTSLATPIQVTDPNDPRINEYGDKSTHERQYRDYWNFLKDTFKNKPRLSPSEYNNIIENYFNSSGFFASPYETPTPLDYKNKVTSVIGDKKEYDKFPLIANMWDNINKGRVDVINNMYSPSPTEIYTLAPQKIEVQKSTSTPELRTINNPNVTVPPIVKNKYRVEYFDPELKQETHRMFPTQEASDAFAKELGQRSINGVPATGNITQRVEYKNGGGLFSRTVTCSNCGHSWKGVDGGEDVMTCHKCGGMIKMKQGGVASNKGYYNVGMGVPQFANGGPGDGVLDNIYTKWPALKKLGNVTLKPDESFTRERTGLGDIEFFSPDLPQVSYPNGYIAPHPGLGTYGILYNPLTNDEQNIRLDMLHGMPDADRHYRRLRNRFVKAVKHSDVYDEMNHWYNQALQNGEAEDGRQHWMDNYTDGQLRTLLYEGDRSKQNYSDEEAEQLLSHPRIKRKFNKLNNYLQREEYGGDIPKYQVAGQFSLADQLRQSVKKKMRGQRMKSFTDNPVDYIGNVISYNKERIGDFLNDAGETVSDYVEGAKKYVSLMQEEDEKNIQETNKDKIFKQPMDTKSDVVFGYNEYGEVPDVDGKRKFAKFTYTFDNDSGARYVLGNKVKEVTEGGAKKHFTNVTAVAHFLRDSDILPNQKFAPSEWTVHGGNKFISTSPGRAMTSIGFDRPNWYRTLYKPNPSKPGEYLVKYVKNKEIDKKAEDRLKNEGWALDFTVSGQSKFSDVDWEGEGPSTKYAAKSKWLPLKNGDHINIPYKDKKGFSRFSGGSITYLFNEPKTGKRIGVDISGSVNDMKAAGESLIQKYKLKPEQLEFVFHDMGSYSAKPKADKNNELDYDQWIDFNSYNRGFSGAPLMIPKEKYGGDISIPQLPKHNSPLLQFYYNRGGIIK